MGPVLCPPFGEGVEASALIAATHVGGLIVDGVWEKGLSLLLQSLVSALVSVCRCFSERVSEFFRGRMELCTSHSTLAWHIPSVL